MSELPTTRQREFPAYTYQWHTETYSSIDPTLPQLSFAKKVVLITGGGQGIGAQIALSFAKAGAAGIGIVGRTETTLKTSAAAILAATQDSTKVTYVVADIAKSDQLENAFQKIRDSLGKIDLLVCNAGYLNNVRYITWSDPMDWWKVFEINVLGVFNSIRAFMPHASAKPMVINLTSGLSHLAPIPGASAYSASKLAATKVIEHLSAEMGDLAVMNMMPGVVETAINLKGGLTGPWDSIQLPADFCVWLASPEAGFLRGKFVYSNWDVDELKAKAERIQNDPNALRISLEGPVRL